MISKTLAMLAATFFLLLSCAGVYADNVGTTLFKNFKYGQSWDEVSSEGNAAPCEDSELQGMLCGKEPVKFLGHDWEEVFVFNNKKELESVVLGMDEFSQEDYISIIMGLAKNGFSPLLLQGGDKIFDVLESAINVGLQKTMERANGFEVATALNDVKYTIIMVPSEMMNKWVASKKFRNYSDAFKSAPSTMHTVSV